MNLERKAPAWFAIFWLMMAVSIRTTSAASIEDMLVTKGFRPGRVAGDPVDTIVLHFSSNIGTDKKNPYIVKAVIKLFEENNSSAHYLMDREGKIYRLVKETDTAYHAGDGVWGKRIDNLNRFSVGIELLGIGTFEEMTNIVQIARKEYDAIPKNHLGFTDAQYTALKELIADIRARHPKIKNDRQHIIGHDEYAPGRKFDPGALFMWEKIGL